MPVKQVVSYFQQTVIASFPTIFSQDLIRQFLCSNWLSTCQDVGISNVLNTTRSGYMGQMCEVKLIRERVKNQLWCAGTLTRLLGYLETDLGEEWASDLGDKIRGLCGDGLKAYKLRKDKNKILARFEVPTAVHMIFSWVLEPCALQSWR
jgi:hypothetical protein